MSESFYFILYFPHYVVGSHCYVHVTTLGSLWKRTERWSLFFVNVITEFLSFHTHWCWNTCLRSAVCQHSTTAFILLLLSINIHQKWSLTSYCGPLISCSGFILKMFYSSAFGVLSYMLRRQWKCKWTVRCIHTTVFKSVCSVCSCVMLPL